MKWYTSLDLIKKYIISSSYCYNTIENIKRAYDVTSGRLKTSVNIVAAIIV